MEQRQKSSAFLQKKCYYPASNFHHITSSALQRLLEIQSIELKRNYMYTITDGVLMEIIELWRYWVEEKQMKEQNIHEK